MTTTTLEATIDAAWEARVHLGVLADADEIYIAGTIDLTATQKKYVDPTLSCTVVDLTAAVVERIIDLAAKEAGPGRTA